MAGKTLETVGSGQVCEAEKEAIRERRRLAHGLPEQPVDAPEDGSDGCGAESGTDPVEDLVGLALSGGGIRSATFNLGLLQALQRYGVLKHIDYLSTVSGGGYIGSSLTWLKSRVPKEFPFGTRRKDHSGIGGKVLAWLRAHGSFLVPGEGLGTWSLIAAMLTGTLVNLLFFVPLLLLTLYLLGSTWSSEVDFLPACIRDLFGLNGGVTGFEVLLLLGSVGLCLFLLSVVAFVLVTCWSFLRRWAQQRWMRKWSGRILGLSVVLVAVGLTPVAHRALAHGLEDWLESGMSAVLSSGIALILGAVRGRKGGSEARGLRSLLLGVGLSLVMYGTFLWGYDTVDGLSLPRWAWRGMAGCSIFVALFAHINHISMHRFYRNRLLEAYMPHCVDDELGYPHAEQGDADRCFLHSIQPSDAPYHIINTHANMTNSSDAKLRNRGGDSFILSRLYCGAESTGYADTGTYLGEKMNLATACAISGAAVTPNVYATRSRPLSALIALLNLRLGYWIRSPRAKKSLFHRPLWCVCMLREIFRVGLSEKPNHIHLADGGHLENLGLYELIRRKCRYIIVSDASSDKDYTFFDLMRAIEMVRLDFGAEVIIDTSDLVPSEANGGRSRRAFVRGRVKYQGSREHCDLLFIKTSLVDGLTEDIYGYRRLNPSFPDQTTTDQFFDERQFEAYRELGYQIGKLACRRRSCDTAARFFDRAGPDPRSAAM